MKKNKKIVFLIFSILLSVVIIILAATVVLNVIIEKKLKTNQTGSINLQCESINTNLFLRQIILNEVYLTDVNSEQKVTIPEIKINGIRIYSLVFGIEYVINELVISNPKVNASGEKIQTSASSGNQSILIKNLEIINAELLYQKNNDSLFFAQLEVNCKNFNIHKNHKKFRFKNNSFDRLNIELKNGKYKFSKLYQVLFENINFNTETSNLKITQAKLVSNYEPYAIGKVTGHETDWYDFALDSFELNGFRLNQLLNDSAFIFNEARFFRFTAEVFRDKRLPFPEKPDSKLPMELIENLPVKFHGDSISIKQANIKYLEKRLDAYDAGAVTFQKLEVNIENLSNIDSLINGPTKMIVSAQTMNQAALNVEFRFPNIKYPQQYKATGTLQSLPINIFNPMIIPTASAKVERGQLKTFAFNFGYDNERSNGDLHFEYENLNITFLNEENKSGKKVKSFLVKTFVLNNNNIKGSESYREGTISYERDKKKSVFQYWWKSLLSGIKSISIN